MMRIPLVPIYTAAVRPVASAEWAGRLIRIRDAGVAEQLQACLQTAAGGWEWSVAAVPGLAVPPTAWTALTLQNGWSANAGWETPGYRLVGDEVQLRGYVEGGVINAVIATLPVGFRPAKKRIFYPASTSTPSPCRIDVDTNGTLGTVGAAGAGYLTLDGIRFDRA